MSDTQDLIGGVMRHIRQACQAHKKNATLLSMIDAYEKRGGPVVRQMKKRYAELLKDRR